MRKILERFYKCTVTSEFLRRNVRGTTRSEQQQRLTSPSPANHPQSLPPSGQQQGHKQQATADRPQHYPAGICQPRRGSGVEPEWC